MARPFLLLQLSDPHIGANWGDGDPAGDLEAAVASVLRLPDPPDAVFVSGDIANRGGDDQYALAREILDQLPAPLYAMAGNHDDRQTLRRHFELPGAGDEPIQYAVDMGAVRLVVIDTTRPGEDTGELDGERLSWLDDALGELPDKPTVLALHHPPLVTGIAVWDQTSLPDENRGQLAELLARHPQVALLAAGHVHRAITSSFAGRPVLVVPSTHLQARLQFDAPELELVSEPPAYALHAVLGGQIVSHLQPVAIA